jgi:Fumarylacetoacetate (FAA) hydrolase family
MRLARVLHESSPFPRVALERDGALYDVSELGRCLGVGRAEMHLGEFGLSADFFERVIALRCAGLATLDERICGGDRPTEARVVPGSFLWLAPCDTERSLFVHVDLPTVAPALGSPRYRLGNGRGLLGHEARVAFPASETRPGFELGLAAVLGEDLRRASIGEAEEAITGYSILNVWVARDEDARHRDSGAARDFGSQLGPVLVTRGELGELSRLRLQARVGGKVMASGVVGHAGDALPEAVAFVSHYVDLRAGDVVGTTCLPIVEAPFGPMVELLIERLGKLSGHAVAGPEMRGWRRG